MTELDAEPKRGAPLSFWLAIFGVSGLFFGATMWRDYARLTAPPPPPHINSMTLIASPDDPQMHEAIREAQIAARGDRGGNAWSKPADSDADVVVKTISGPILLTHAEIAQANEIYPHLVSRAKNRHVSTQSADAGFDEEFHDQSEWGN